VNSDGKITATDSRDKIWNGIASSDGSLVVYVDKDYIGIHLKESESLSNSVLKGDYIGIIMASNGFGVGSISYDGSGNLKYTYDIGFSATDIGTYSVNSDGKMTATDSRGKIWNGIVSSDGSIVIYVDRDYIGIQLKRKS